MIPFPRVDEKTLSIDNSSVLRTTFWPSLKTMDVLQSALTHLLAILFSVTSALFLVTYLLRAGHRPSELPNGI